MELGFKKENIQGWGIDVRPEDRPAYPMWKKVEDTGSHYDEDEIPKQKKLFTVLKSVERPADTPVFGQTVPPVLLSGLIRKFAFRYSEGSFGHWLPLLLADRINVFEGLASDLLHLRVPNLWKEMGLSAEWKYNRASFVKKTVVTATLLAGSAAVFVSLNQDKKKGPV